MLTQSTRRPLSAWKGALRCVRQQQQQRQRQLLVLRTMATETTPTSSSSSTIEPPPSMPTATKATPPKPYIHPLKPRNPTLQPRSKFAIYPGLPSSTKTVPSPVDAYHAQQIRRLDRKGLRTFLFSKANPDSAKPGDVLQVTTKRGEPFAGVCLSIRRAGVDTAILLRNHLTKIGVEMWYKIYSPNIVGIEIVWRRPRRARRARLTYMRQPKHDMGNVDHLVAAWRRTRNVFSSKGKAAGTPAAGAARGSKRQ